MSPLKIVQSDRNASITRTVLFIADSGRIRQGFGGTLCAVAPGSLVTEHLPQRHQAKAWLGATQRLCPEAMPLGWDGH